MQVHGKSDRRSFRNDSTHYISDLNFILWAYPKEADTCIYYSRYLWIGIFWIWALQFTIVLILQHALI